MEDAEAKIILGMILHGADGWTGKSIWIEELANKLHIPFDDAEALVDEMTMRGWVWRTGDKESGKLGVAVSKEGRHFLDGFPNPTVDMWANAPAPHDEANKSD
jgi:DNA-binding IclR family transcriptional regulator